MLSLCVFRHTYLPYQVKARKLRHVVREDGREMRNFQRVRWHCCEECRTPMNFVRSTQLNCLEYESDTRSSVCHIEA